MVKAGAVVSPRALLSSLRCRPVQHFCALQEDAVSESDPRSIHNMASPQASQPTAVKQLLIASVALLSLPVLIPLSFVLSPLLLAYGLVWLVRGSPHNAEDSQNAEPLKVHMQAAVQGGSLRASLLRVVNRTEQTQHDCRCRPQQLQSPASKRPPNLTALLQTYPLRCQTPPACLYLSQAYR